MRRIESIADVKSAQVMPLHGGLRVMGLALRPEVGAGQPLFVAVPSWHTDYSGAITWPAMGDYRDDWLAMAVGGSYPPPSDKLADCVLSWLEQADLSPLADRDDWEGHQRLASSLMAAIRRCRDE